MAAKKKTQVRKVAHDGGTARVKKTTTKPRTKVRIIRGTAVARKREQLEPAKAAKLLVKRAAVVEKHAARFAKNAAKLREKAAKLALRALTTRADSYSDKQRDALEVIASSLFPDSTGAVATPAADGKAFKRKFKKVASVDEAVAVLNGESTEAEQLE